MFTKHVVVKSTSGVQLNVPSSLHVYGHNWILVIGDEDVGPPPAVHRDVSTTIRCFTTIWYVVQTGDDVTIFTIWKSGEEVPLDVLVLVVDCDEATVTMSNDDVTNNGRG